MATTIVLTNQKGGVGKTTTTSAVVSGLIKMGKRVLSVDLDPQGNLGFCLGMNIESGNSIYDVLSGSMSVRDAIQETESYGDILLANILLSEGNSIFSEENPQSTLKDALSEVDDDYDYIVIDTPPALNILTINGYVAADFLIIPMAAEILSLVGLAQLRETVVAVQRKLNPELKVLGIILTRYNNKSELSADVCEMAEAVASQIDTVIFDTKIRTGISVCEAPAHGLSILDYSPRSNPARDYKNFVVEMMKRMNGKM